MTITATEAPSLRSPVEHDEECPAAAARRRRRRAVAIGLGIGGIALVGSGAFASWSATSTVSSATLDAASTGVQIVDAANGTFSTPVANLLPGDYFNRYVDLRNTGTAAAPYVGTVKAAGALGAALTVQVQQCSLPWDTAKATCPGEVSPMLPVTTLGTSGTDLSHGTIRPGTEQAQHVRYLFTLPASAPDVLKGTSTSIEATVTGELVGGTDRTQG